MAMDSDDDLDHLPSSFVSEVQKSVAVVKPFTGSDTSSDEDAKSIKSESDDEQEADDSVGPSRADSSLLDASVKSEPESEEEDGDDAEKDALISSYLSALKSSQQGELSTDLTSDEDDGVSIKSESEDDDVSVKSEPVTESDSEQPELKDSGNVAPANDEKELVNDAVETALVAKKKSIKPAKDKKKLSNNEKKPANDGKKPANDGKKPANDGKKPANERKKPAIEGKKPANKKKDKKMKQNLVALEAKKKERVAAKIELRKQRAERRATKTVSIDTPTSAHEKELMSLVFGGTKQLVSKLDTEENKETDKNEASKAGNDRNPLWSKLPDVSSQPKRRAIWHDSDDDDVEDSANMKRNKFSYEELPEQLTNERRRKQFEQIVGKPKWADLDRVKEPDSDDEILQTVGHVVKGTPSQGLPKGMIELKKLKNLNRETKAEGEISSISFHPTSMVAIITGKRGLVSIVAVDGVRNEKLHTIWLPKMRVVCSRLLPDGNEVIFGSYRKFYHVYNLINGQSDTLKIPERETWMMKNFRVSRCGKYLASAGDCGEVHLMSAKTKEVMQTIQLRYTCQSLAFTPDSRYLLCHSNDTEVSVFSLEQKRIVNVFQDDGCVNGSCITVCPNGHFVATGSRQGIVNVYALDDTLTQKLPVPLKTINNLTTYIDSLSFNATSELLLIASSTVKNAVKLIHVKSGTVFRNFPLHMAHLGHVTVGEFSPSGGYLALGTKESTVLLFRVKHYPNY